VADDGTFHYSAGQSIATALGTYHIYAAEGSTTQAVGTVNNYFYYDGAGNGRAYTPFYSALKRALARQRCRRSWQ